MTLSFARVVALALTLTAASHAPRALADDPVPAANRWAAVAFSRSRPSIGRAHSEPTEFMAKEVAVRACFEKDCELKTYVKQGCIGIAKGFEDKTGWTWWAFGAAKFFDDVTPVKQRKLDVRIAAGEAAKTSCDSASHQLDCAILETFCTWDEEGQETTAEMIKEWIDEMGGEGSQGLQNTLQLVNVASQAYLLNVGVNFEKSSCLSTRRWPNVRRLATTCGLNLIDLDRLYTSANQYPPRF